MGDVINVDFLAKPTSNEEKLDAALCPRFKQVLTDAGFSDAAASAVANIVGSETAKRVAGLDQLLKFTVSGKLDFPPGTTPQEIASAVSQMWATETQQRFADIGKYASYNIALAAFDALKVLAASDQLPTK
jgi:hypothetical protein